MFELGTLTPAKLASVNCRAELHGAESVPAVDLKFSFDAANSILSEFDGWLLSSLYMKRGPKDKDSGQAVLEGVEPVSDVPNLRMPGLGMPLKWDVELTGYHLRLEYGIGGKSSVELDECKANTFTIDAKEGGTVTVGVRVQATSGLTEKILGKLATLVQHDVQIALTPPADGRQQTFDAEPEKTLDERVAAGEPAWPFPDPDKAPSGKGAPVEERDPGPAPVAAAKKVRRPPNSKTSATPPAKQKLAIKYRNAATGETWSGRGLQPKWIKAALLGGKKLQDFAL